MEALAGYAERSASGIGTRVLPRTKLQVSELGFGGACLGNLYREVSDGEARETLAASLAAGITYYDTAPHYGFGLGERRLGDGLRGKDVTVSTKVGRLLKALPRHRGSSERSGFCTPMPFEPAFDYSYGGVMRSYEDSLQRLGLARVDILYVHDIGPLTHGAAHAKMLRQLVAGHGFRALEDLRASGEIAAFGLGVNEWEVCLEVMEETELDLVLLAGRYSLLDQSALDAFLPACQKRTIGVILGGVYNSGILATGTRSGGPTHFDYAPAAPEVLARVARIEAVCERHAVRLPAAALQFALAHPQVASVIPGLSGARQIDQTLDLYSETIPADFWAELKGAGLLREDAPVPVAVPVPAAARGCEREAI